MRVKMLITRVGGSAVFDSGKEYEVPDVRAERWVSSGWAVAVGEVSAAVVVPPEEGEPEFAVAPSAPELAIKRGRRK